MFNNGFTGARTNVIGSSEITDGSIVNADVNTSAAIAGTKISPDFGSQNIATTGYINNTKILGVSTTEVSINSNTPTNILSLSIPANSLDTNNLIEFIVNLDIFNNTGSNQTLTLALKYGSTTLCSLVSGNLSTNANKRMARVTGFLKGNTATNAQKGGIMFTSPTAVVAGFTGIGTSAEDSTGALNLTLVVTLGATDATNYILNMTDYKVTLYNI